MKFSNSEQIPVGGTWKTCYTKSVNQFDIRTKLEGTEMQAMPVSHGELINVIFNAIEKGSNTSEFEVTAIAEVVSHLYSRIEKQDEIISSQEEFISKLK